MKGRVFIHILTSSDLDGWIDGSRREELVNSRDERLLDLLKVDVDDEVRLGLMLIRDCDVRSEGGSCPSDG